MFSRLMRRWRDRRSPRKTDPKQPERLTEPRLDALYAYRVVVSDGNPMYAGCVAKCTDLPNAQTVLNEHLAARQREGWAIIRRDETEAVIARPHAAGGVIVLLTLAVAIVPECMVTTPDKPWLNQIQTIVTSPN